MTTYPITILILLAVASFMSMVYWHDRLSGLPADSTRAVLCTLMTLLCAALAAVCVIAAGVLLALRVHETTRA